MTIEVTYALHWYFQIKSQTWTFINIWALSTFGRGTKDDILYYLWTTIHQVLVINSSSGFDVMHQHQWLPQVVADLLYSQSIWGSNMFGTYGENCSFLALLIDKTIIRCKRTTLCHFNPKVPWLKIEGHQAESLAGCSLSNPRKARNVWWCNQWENSVGLLQCPHSPHAH